MTSVVPAENAIGTWNQTKGVRILDNLVATTPYSIAVAGLFASLVSQNPVGMYVLMMFATTEVLNGVVIKPLTKKIAGNSETIARPGGKSNVTFGSNPKGCGIYYEGKASTSSGMPSGHAQSMGLFGVFFTLYILAKIKRDKKVDNDVDVSKYYASIVGVWIIALVVILHRSPLWSNCHSPLQLLFGSGIGGLLGWGFYEIFSQGKIMLRT